MKILLTNDDGIWAVGLRALYKAFKKEGFDVCVVAPLNQQSAVGHAVTLMSPIRVKEIKENHFEGIGVKGTPVDCIKFALSTLFKEKKVDLVVSGINNGANVGIDVLYSATVAAATEAALLNIPAISASVDCFNPTNLDEQANFIVNIVKNFNLKEILSQKILNINFPNRPLSKCKGVKICPQTKAIYKDWYEKRIDPRGVPYYWLCGEIPPENLEPDSDRYLLTEGYITITPLKFDLTDYDLIKKLSETEFSSLIKNKIF